MALYVRMKGHGTWRIELKRVNRFGGQTELQRWGNNTINEPDYVVLRQDLANPSAAFKLLNVVAETDSEIWFDEVGFVMDIPVMPELKYAFLASACQVFRCYDPQTGHVRDKSFQPARKFPGERLSSVSNSVPGLGFAAMTAACASSLGLVDEADARGVAQKTISSLLAIAANQHVAHGSGFLPHWICVKEDGVTVTRHPDSEFSTVDTALAYLSAYAAARTLGLETERAAIMGAVRALDFDAVTLPGNRISHGFNTQGQLLENAWTEWGGETALLMILAKLNDPSKTWCYCPIPPVYRGRGFIQELAPLFFSRFGGSAAFGADAKGVDWYTERLRLLREQKAVLNMPVFFGGHSPCEIISGEGRQAYLEAGTSPPALGGVMPVPGASPGTEPEYTRVEFGAPWVAPHYSAMTSSLELGEAVTRVAFMRNNGLLPHVRPCRVRFDG
jgi:hypothetical protein